MPKTVSTKKPRKTERDIRIVLPAKFADHLTMRAHARKITQQQMIYECLMRAEKSVEIPETLMERVDRCAERLGKGREPMLEILIRQGLDRLERA